MLLWDTALYLIIFSSYVVGGIAGVLLCPRPESTFTRFWLSVIVGILFALAALYNPCMREGLIHERTYAVRCATSEEALLLTYLPGICIGR